MKIKQFIKKNYNFLHHMASSYGAIGINILIFAFLTPYMLNNLGKEQYGTWQLVSNITMYFSLGSLGLGSVFYLEFTKHRADALMMNKLISTLFFALLFVSIIISAIFLFIIFQFDSLFIISTEFLPKARVTFLISFFGFIVIFLFNFLDISLFLNHKITTRNISEIIKIVINGLGSIILIYLGFDIVAIALLSMVCNVLQMVYYYAIVSRIQPFTINFSYFDREYLKTMYKNGVYFFIYTLSSLVIMNTDNILISHFMGAVYVSLYAVIFRFVTISEKFIFVLSTVKGPKVSTFIQQDNYSAVFDIYKKVWLATLATSLVVAVGLSTFGIDILHLWIGNKFEYDAVLIYIFSIFIVIHSLSSVTSWYLGILNKVKIQSMVSLVEIVANLFLSIALYPHLGLRGIALGTLISHVLVGSWYPTLYLHRFLKAKI